MMLLIVLIMIALSLFVIGPYLLIAGCRIFKADPVTYKKALVVNLLILLSMLVLSIINYIIGFKSYFANGVVYMLALLAGTWIIKKTFKSAYPRSAGIFLFSFLVSALLGFLVMAFVVQSYQIPPKANSMTPALMPGDYFFVNKFVYCFKKPARDDIVAFKSPGEQPRYLVKRVIALGGEEVEIRDKVVYVNGKPLNDSYGHSGSTEIIPREEGVRDNCGPFTVPEGSYFLMGDNRDDSYDSRHFGCVKRSSIIGSPGTFYWSRDYDKGKVRWNRIGKRIQ